MNKNVYKLMLFLLLFFVGLGDVYGDENKDGVSCYYLSNSSLEKLTGQSDGTYIARMDYFGKEISKNKVYSFIRGNSLVGDEKGLYNYNRANVLGPGLFGTDGYWFPAYDRKSGQCPQYIIYLEYHLSWSNWFPADFILATNDRAEVEKIASFVNEGDYRKKTGLYGIFFATSKKSDGSYYTREDYEAVISSNGNIDIELPGFEADVNCSENSLFGDPNENGDNSGGVPSLAYIIKFVLNLVRWIVPIIIICLGTIDLFMAMISDKDDKMVAAQQKLIKRIIAGVCVFFVPTFVSLLMDLANNAFVGEGNLLEGSFCYFNW